MKSFRRTTALVFLIAGVIISGNNKAIAKTDEGGDVLKSFKVNKGGTLKVSINSGDITIDTWNKNEVNVKIEDVDEDQYNQLKISQSDNNVTVQYNGSGYNNSSDVKISVPAEYNLDLQTNQGEITVRGNLKGTCQAATGGGDINLSSITGYVNVKTSGGEITIGNTYGDLTVSTSGGDINIGNISGKGDIRTNGGTISMGNVGKYLIVKTMGGDISAGDIGGNADVNTMGGDISVKKVSGSASLKTNGGDVKILGSSGSVIARTYGGDLTLSNINGTVDASTSSGDIYVELRSTGGGSSKLESMNGSVRLYIDPNIKVTIYANVRLSGWSGDNDEKPISSEFPVKSYESGKYSGEVKATYLINGGGDNITIKTINDGIELKKLRK